MTKKSATLLAPGRATVTRMKCAIGTRPKPIASPKPAPQIPLDDAEALALFLVEHVLPAMRRELGRLLVPGAQAMIVRSLGIAFA